jgi:biotin carboxylase
MKRALILGVSSAQVDAIRYLKQAGWWVIGCSYRREGKGLELVDQFDLVDIKDSAAIEQLGRNENIDLIYSVGSDLAMPTVAKVASKLGLPTFVRYETAELMQDKAKLRDFLAAHDISRVKYRMVASPADLDGWDHFPAMVKPVDSQGQRGVFRADSFSQIESGFDGSLEFSKSKRLIVEEYLEGPEVSANAFVINAQVVFSQISDRLVAVGYPGGIPRGHILPAKKCLGAALREIRAQIERCIQALEIENGPVYFQSKLTAQGPKIIEITPRLDGCHIWRLVKAVGGADLLAASFELLTGGRPANLQMSWPLVGHRLSFFLSPPGNVFSKADHCAPPNASYVEYYYKDGETIRPVNGLLEKVGYYIQREE